MSDLGEFAHPRDVGYAPTESGHWALVGTRLASRRMLARRDDRQPQINAEQSHLNEGDKNAAAEDVGNPFPCLPGIIQIEHRGDGVDAKAVDMIMLEPEEGVAEEEVSDLGAAVIEDLGPPVAMLAHPRVGVLEQVGGKAWLVRIKQEGHATKTSTMFVLLTLGAASLGAAMTLPASADDNTPTTTNGTGNCSTARDNANN